MNQSMSSIMIRNVPVDEKRKFEAFCTANGTTIQETIRKLIASCNNLDEDQVVLMTAYLLCNSKQDTVDAFITEVFPDYPKTPDSHKENMRISFVSSRPEYIFRRYAKELQKKEDEAVPESSAGQKPQKRN